MKFNKAIRIKQAQQTKQKKRKNYSKPEENTKRRKIRAPNKIN